MGGPERSAVAQEKLRSSKKRGRRTLNTGAANDCFACQELHVRCDRRRPYCTQCLEHGKKCSGYKTALTWNVGVASRGKLRGLALPIVTSERTSRRSITKGRKKWVISNRMPEPGPASSDFCPATTTQTFYPAAEKGTKQFGLVNMDSPHSATSLNSDPLAARCPWAPQSDIHISPCMCKRPRRYSSEPLLVPALDHLQGYQDFPMPANISDLYDDRVFGTSAEYSPTAAFKGRPARELSGPRASLDSSNGEMCTTSHEPGGWSLENCSGPNPDPLATDHTDHKPLPTFPAWTSTADNIFLRGSCDAYGFPTNGEIWNDSRADPNIRHSIQDEGTNIDVQNVVGNWTPGFSQSRVTPDGKINKVQFLIDYYDRVVPPISATYGNSSHPYKSNLLRLAVASKAVQHALAALAANYMRQRSAAIASMTRSKQPFSKFFHDEFVRYSFVHNTLDAGRNQSAFVHSNGNSVDEIFFKETCFKLLNEQLAAVERRRAESLQAAILILCLEHTCTMGLENLKRHHVEVAEMLSLHGDSSIIDFEAMTWLAVMFTWYDSMVVTGGQGREHVADASMIPSSAYKESWSVGILAGHNCKLFDIITQLNSNVGDQMGRGSSLQATKLGFGRMSSSFDKGFDYCSMVPNQDDGSQPAPLVDARVGLCVQFWRERGDVRAELEQTRNPPSPKAAALQQVNSTHLSEAFRYVALLYNECVVLRHAEEVQAHVQTLMKRLIYHVSSVPNDLSLLLPLFIAGLKSPSEQTCQLLGAACLDMQEDSQFLKNISAMELLQHLWQGDDSDEAA